MNCAEVREHLNAWLDGELPDELASQVEAHVDACRACGDLANELRQQEVALLRAFQPRRAAAATVAQRVAAALPTKRPPVVPRGSLWLYAVTALLGIAAGFAAAVFLLRVDQANESESAPVAVVPGPVNPTPVARLVVATGPVELRARKATSWEALDGSRQRACLPDSAVRTPPDVRCELQTSDGCVIRLNGDSAVTLRTGRLIEIEAGQVWCSTPPGVSLEVVPGAWSAVTDPGHSSIPVLMCPASTSCVASVVPNNTTQVTAATGQLQIRTPDGSQLVSPGQTAVFAAGQVSVEDRSSDPVLSSTWMHPLLALKGHGDDDLQQRVDELLADVGQSKLSHFYEQEIRGLGEYSVLPLLRFVQSPQSREQPARRATALRILADMAPSWTIPDLIELLSDADGLARMHAAQALQRLTTLTFDCDAETWRAGGEPCTFATEQWRVWWEMNKAQVAPGPSRLTEA